MLLTRTLSGVFFVGVLRIIQIIQISIFVGVVFVTSEELTSDSLTEGTFSLAHFTTLGSVVVPSLPGGLGIGAKITAAPLRSRSSPILHGIGSKIRAT